LRYSIPHSRFTVRFFGFVLFVALAFAATVPVRLAAQAAAPAPSSAPVAAAPNAQAGEAAKPEAAKSEAAKSEADEENVYRHAPIVQTLARILHLNLETSARLFEFINFGIIVLAVGIPLVRYLPKVLRRRSQTLRHDIDSARKVTEDANTRLSAVEAKLSSLGEEIAQMRAHVEEESKQDEVRIKATIDEESTRIVAAAEQEIGVAAAQAKRGLRNFAADLAIEQATRQLVLTPEADRTLIAEFVRDVNLNGADKGGQN
jgi:F-type H+-transporting ATPase subunit b